LISDFLPTMSFLHNLRSNISRYAGNYMKEYEKAIANLKQSQNTHQLSILIHDDVEIAVLEKIDKTLIDLGYANIQESSTIYQGMDIEFRQYGCGEVDSEDKLINSSVQIKVNGKHAGSGFLFTYCGEMYCVSSQHLLDIAEPIQSVSAVSAANDFEFDLRPKNQRGNRKSGKRTAKDDVLVFSINLSECSDFDSRYIFSQDDCITNSKIGSPEIKYTLFGFGQSSSVLGKRNLQLESCGPIAKGFIEMKCCEGELEPGDSGAAVVMRPDNALYGIHAQSTDPKGEISQRLLVCPIKILLAELEKIKEG